MQTETAVRRAKSPHEAMLALARGIDRLEGLVLGRSDDAWFDEWPRAASESQEHTFMSPLDPKYDRTREADTVREQLATADAEDRPALEAKLRLLTDSGAPVESPVTEGTRPAIEYEDGMIVLPPAGIERQLRRRTWLFEHLDTLLSFYPGGVMTPDMLTDGYVKGGPLWLYYQDNRKLLEMPVEWRREFVEDIAQDSQAAAQEIGRDLLKDANPISPGEAVEALSA